LWLGLNDGISKLEFNSPFSIYDKRAGLSGLVLSVVKHRNKLYAGTTNGLYLFVPSGSSAFMGKFHIVPGITDNCWSLLSVGDSLLAGTTEGVFKVGDRNKKNTKLIKNRSYFLLRSHKDKNRIWTATREGFFSLYLNEESGRWAVEHKFKNIAQEITIIVENKNGNLWLGTLTKGVIKVDFPGDTITNYEVNRYHTSHGLPAGDINVFWAAGHVLFATREGIFRFDERTKVFIPDSTLGKEFTGGPDGKGVFYIAENRHKNIWFYSKGRNFQAVPQGNAYVIHSKPLRRLTLKQVNFIYPSPDGDTVWFARHDGLIRFNPTIEKNCDLDFSILIRKIVANGKLVFDGSEQLFPVIPYEDRNLHVEFAAPFFEGESRIYYRCFLEGHDKNLPDFTTETHRDYPGLDSGLYTFRVQAENIYGEFGKEAVFRFRILTPWYRTWWAFMLYAAVFFLLMFFINKWRHSIQLAKEKQRLEKIVLERTKEIIDKNQQLEEQSEKLQEMDKAKSRFFANISHEFRTPLTLIMGPVEQMLSGSLEKDRKERLNLVLRNSHRLLTLINQLLDLSRFDGGKMKLTAARQNIVPFLKGILASFELVASQKKIDLIFSVHQDEEDITLYFDAEKLEEVIGNLLSNALKFTPGGGEITVALKEIAAKTGGENVPPDFLDISVRDTGIGISKEQLAHIFDRFYQAKGFTGDRQDFDPKGTGIGLALAKELVNLHHGKIDVHSSEGKGTEFIVRLPMGNEHLKPDEIVEPSEITTDRKKPGEMSPLSIVEEKEEDDTGAVAAASDNGKNGEPETPDKNVILVVEDNAEVRRYIKGALEPLYTVKEAVNGREGIDRAREIIPDLIISDIMMPEVDGCELCKTLKTDIKTSHVPIILLTAKASEENIIEGLETGADDYITKPFNTTILCTRIKNLIDLRRHIQEKIQRLMMMQPAEIQVSSMDQTFIKEVQTAIEKNLSEPEFNVDQLGKTLYMSRATLYRKIQALTGESPRDFIRSYRLKRGAQLLKAHFGNVTEVAFEVGFSSTAYFTKCFKEKFHQLPHAFQAAEGS
jgi:signal transduction histidine kinase/DNA-binding response OmpR family regulator